MLANHQEVGCGTRLLELGHRLHPTPMRTTAFAKAEVLPQSPPAAEKPVPVIGSGSLEKEHSDRDTLSAREQESNRVLTAACQESHSSVIYGPPEWARTAREGIFAGGDFQLQPDGTLRCPADHPLYAQERRPERDGTVRVVYAARIGHCRACPLREHC